jgi:hypothetical protein
VTWFGFRSLSSGHWGGRRDKREVELLDADITLWPIATLPQEFMSAMPPKADKPEPTRMTQSCRHALRQY